MTAPAEPVETIDDQAAALDAEQAALAVAFAQVEDGRAARVAQVDADEAALKAARQVLWEVSQEVDTGRDIPGPRGAEHPGEAAQRQAAHEVGEREQAAQASRGAWLAGEVRRNELLMAQGRLAQRRARLAVERERARRAAPSTGDALAAIKRRLGFGG